MIGAIDTCGHPGARAREHYCAGTVAVCDTCLAKREARWADAEFRVVDMVVPRQWWRCNRCGLRWSANTCVCPTCGVTSGVPD